ncbi:MAG TPA: helix-turn-helix domain-containing protein [Rugosimonospora sp.]|nr:helix-turn-helix domain-containing protein [Rugosimonospora sp.]
MTSPRRIGAPDAKNRAVLLDAAEQLMIEEGYAAVTSRRIATRAGLKPQLVHYYFRTMDDLFLAVFQRRAEEGVEAQAQALASDRPLHALWEFSTDANAVALTMEFVALANHRKAIRAEIARYAEMFRAIQIEALTAMDARQPIGEGYPPAVLAVLLASLSRMIVMEQVVLGMSGGHAETLDLVKRQLDRIEGPDPVP